MMRAFAVFVYHVVPLLLFVSGCLIGGRFTYDALHIRMRSAAKVVFSLAIALAAIVSLIVLMRAAAIADAYLAFARGNWPRAARGYARYESLGANVSRGLAREWAVTLLNMRRWNEAIPMFFRTGIPSPAGPRLDSDVVLHIGECMYYMGEVQKAASAFTAAARTSSPYVREYFLGRVSERGGDPSAALGHYDAAIRLSPRFFPAWYQRIRQLALVRGRDAALAACDDYRKSDPVWRQNWIFLRTVEFVEQGRDVPQREFHFVYSE